MGSSPTTGTQTEAIIASGLAKATGILAHWLLVGESFSVGFLQTNHCALAVSQESRVVAMVEFGQVKRQVLFADMVERANHATL